MAKWFEAHYNQAVRLFHQLSVRKDPRPHVLTSLLNQTRNYYYYYMINEFRNNNYFCLLLVNLKILIYF